jgi:alpha-N-arabinofuranosidase
MLVQVQVLSPALLPMSRKTVPLRRGIIHTSFIPLRSPEDGLAGVGVGAVATASRAIRARGQATGDTSVTVLLDEPIATIRPAIYSQFAEHIGGVIYDGIWVGRDSKVANVDGIRRTLIEHVKQLGPVVVRWPGGCFADKYHWRDGIGP